MSEKTNPVHETPEPEQLREEEPLAEGVPVEDDNEEEPKEYLDPDMVFFGVPQFYMGLLFGLFAVCVGLVFLLTSLTIIEGLFVGAVIPGALYLIAVRYFREREHGDVLGSDETVREDRE